MDNERKEKLITNLTNNLPVLRTMLHMSQSDLANTLVDLYSKCLFQE